MLRVLAFQPLLVEPLNLSLPTRVEFARLLVQLDLPGVPLPGSLPLAIGVQIFARSLIHPVAFTQQLRVSFGVPKP